MMWRWIADLFNRFKSNQAGNPDEAEPARRSNQAQTNQEDLNMGASDTTQSDSTTAVVDPNVSVPSPAEAAPAADEAQAVKSDPAKQMATDEVPAVKQENAPAQATETAPAVVAATLTAQEPVLEAFVDLYAASSQAFANSRAMKAQKEKELEDLEKALPEAETNRTTAVKQADDAVATAQTHATTTRRDADAEVDRIKDAIAAKQLEIEKAEAKNVETAEALVGVLNGYISRHSS